MKIKISILTFFICTIFSIGSYSDGIIENILKETKCDYVESGLVLNIKDTDINEVKNIEESLDNFKSMYDISIDKTSLEKEKRIYISILCKNNNIDLNILKNDILKKLNVENINIKSNIYYKGKLKEENLNKYKDGIEKKLLLARCKNIKITPINNGIAGTAYSSTYDYIETKEGRVDISFALCKYKSGTYIVIGSPIITCGY